MILLTIIIFIIGYLLIALEHPLKINKTASALLTGVLCWTVFAMSGTDHLFIKSELSHHLAEISGILFFLMGAMTIVELVDAHNGFRFVTNLVKTTNITSLLWIICGVAFFLSAILDNLTTAIVMVSLVRKLIPDEKRRLFFAGMIIIAANAGGAWSPIGDVTTTMLWMGGQITSAAIIKQTFLPSVACLVVPMIYLTFRMKGDTIPSTRIVESQDSSARSSLIMLCVGVGSLVSVPIFKSFTHLPPYMGMLMGLGVLWVVSEFINPEMDEAERRKFSAAHALSRIDCSGILFFMGILLAVGALESMDILSHFASYLNDSLGDNRIIISVIGVVSAVVDNVPLVAACMGMYSMDVYPTDHMIWEYLAYCAGTGGSLLVIGSAAGVAVMGMERVSFTWYLGNISLLALLGYVAGAVVFLSLAI
jgi:Na+/H+ antiporter NhaD/arsenite permease-like protein